MALRDAVLVLSERWPDVRRKLTTEHDRALIQAMSSLTQEPDDEALMLEILSLVASVLPQVVDGILIWGFRVVGVGCTSVKASQPTLLDHLKNLPWKDITAAVDEIEDRRHGR